MWVIGMLVCAGLLLGGHAFMNTGHGSHSHEGAAAQKQVAPATAPDSAATAPDDAATAPTDALQPEPEHHH